MSQKIVFLQDGSVTAKRLKRAFVAAGHECLEASCETTLHEQLNAGGTVVLHVPVDPKRFEKALGRLALEKPLVPILHIMEESVFQPSEWLRTPLTEWMRITAPIEMVLRRVEILAHFARLEQEVYGMRDYTRRIDLFTREIRSSETAPAIRSAMEILRAEFQAENVIWFQDDSFRLELDRHLQGGPATAIRSGKDVRVPWISLDDCPPDRMAELLHVWGAIKPVESTDLRSISVRSPICLGADVIVPIQQFCGMAGSPPYGHLVLMKPKAWESLKDTKLCRSYFDLLSQQLSETLSFDQLKAMTYKDDLTDLYNQRYLPLILEQEVDRASRNEKEFSVLFLDIDYFKSVNDTNGHLVGSRVLIELSKLFRSAIRRTDYAFRYGGDEYVIVLSGANASNATMVAERLRERAAGSTFDINGNQVNVTVSIGIATYPQHAKSKDELLNMADEAMYHGKHKSRNIVQIAS